VKIRYVDAYAIFRKRVDKIAFLHHIQPGVIRKTTFSLHESLDMEQKSKNGSIYS